ncbi:uncharacterized protein ISCGN_031143 [Ixodes scapularis]
MAVAVQERRGVDGHRRGGSPASELFFCKPWAMDHRGWYLLVGAAWIILTLGGSTALSDADEPCGIALERSRRAEMTPEERLQSCFEQNGFKHVNCVFHGGSVSSSPPTPRRLYKKHKSGDVLNRAARQLIMNAYVQVRHEPPAKPGQPGLTVEESCIKAWTVRRLLHDIGFEHDKRERNSRLIEREDIVAWQQKYLHEIARHRQDGRKIFYLDETWVTAGHTVSKVWVDTTVASSHDAFMRGLSTGLKQPSGKGQRLIVTHIGSDEGFVDGCLDVFRGQKTGDYHEEMDGARFEKWFDGVLDKLPTGSVIVMDNASYHSRRLEAVPTTSSRKDDIRQWLTSKKISWDPKMVKKQLLDIVALVKPQHLKYRVDTAAETAGCTVVRLPPYHCEFNPIELIWAQIKNGVAARNTTFKIVDVGRLLNEEVDKVTTDNWINAVRHVIDIEATFRRGGATSAHIQPIVIQLDGEDTPSESDLSGVEPLDEA